MTDRGPHWTTVRHSERPELWDRIPEDFAGVVPEYNLHGDIGDLYWDRMFKEFPEYQFLLYDERADAVLGTGRSLPRAWDGTPAGLGNGLDESIAAAFTEREAGIAPTALCALGVEVSPAHQGRGLSKVLLRELAVVARAAGLDTVIVPVRPTHKELYPTIPIERYAAWTREDGSPFDPWVRTQVKVGGVLAHGTAQSSRITGTVAEWESWTGLEFPEDGDYVFPHGLAPVHIDRERDLGTYWEPGVWITHDARVH
ncbi:GNAT family N-acetyltransferase [Streptomyces sp. NRRL WC-3742]|uniref:GNAT family N-acetyltransferase n=1 Tax=Streptomyces sp. NRRL WC-3742 TaxID=1463934 RepID=UPI0004CC21E5|nr:GNAT family N-acetyltransferase [Streptomyces sp. NRRL WC-3742]